MSDFFRFSAESYGLVEELNAAADDVKKKIPGALQFVGADMQESLMRHLREDWYEAWGEPLVYERDADKRPARSIMSKTRMHVEVDGEKLLFDYMDNKRIASGSWTEDDQVIKVIGSNSGWQFPPKRDIFGRYVMPRPFWNNFVNEMKNEGIMQSFITGMKLQGISIEKDTAGVNFSPDESIVK